MYYCISDAEGVEHVFEDNLSYFLDLVTAEKRARARVEITNRVCYLYKVCSDNELDCIAVVRKDARNRVWTDLQTITNTLL